MEGRAGLPSLGMGIIRACFQMEGRSEFLTERLNRVVRKEMARRPMCLRWTIVIPSGPAAVDDLALRMAAMVSSSLKGINSGSNFFLRIFRKTFRVMRRWL